MSKELAAEYPTHGAALMRVHALEIMLREMTRDRDAMKRERDEAEARTRTSEERRGALIHNYHSAMGSLEDVKELYRAKCMEFSPTDEPPSLASEVKCPHCNQLLRLWLSHC